MGSYGLQFAWKLTFVNKWTVRLLGKAKPGKKFIRSNYEARKKGKIHTSRSMLATEMPNSTHLEAEEKQAEIHAKDVRDLTSMLRPLRRQIAQLELRRMEIGWKVRNSQWNPASNNYCELKKIRQQIADKRLEVIKLEKALSKARSSLYSLNKALQQKLPLNANSITTNCSASESEIKEDNIELVSICCGFCFLLFCFYLLTLIFFQYRWIFYLQLLSTVHQKNELFLLEVIQELLLLLQQYQEHWRKFLVISIAFKQFQLRMTLLQSLRWILSMSSSCLNQARLQPNKLIMSPS